VLIARGEGHRRVVLGDQTEHIHLGADLRTLRPAQLFHALHAVKREHLGFADKPNMSFMSMPRISGYRNRS
jgi:hypothetical protein